MEDLEIIERQKFIDVYTEFDKWLISIGFKNKRTSNMEDYHYSTYNELITPMYSVEHYSNEFLMMSIRFLRDSYEHKFIIASGNPFGQHSTTMTIDEMKELILTQSIETRDQKIKELESLNLN